MENFILNDINDIEIENLIKIYNSNELFLINNYKVNIIDENFIINKYENVNNNDFITFLVTDINGNEIGLCEYKLGFEANISLIMIENKPEYRGLGNIIYKQIENNFVDFGVVCVKIQIKCYKNNSLNFWIRNGYIPSNQSEDKTITLIKML